MKPSRKLRWVSSIDPANQMALATLQSKMKAFYECSSSYYQDIDSSEWRWNEDPIFLDIIDRLGSARNICEVGCGSAHLLRARPQLESAYSGCDFSPGLMASNKASFSSADFRQIKDPANLPFSNEAFDAVFSVCVIEHTVYPAQFLDECVRILKAGGLMMLVCPNYLGTSELTSQRAGFSAGNGSTKIRQYRIVDAIVTGWDRKVRIPARCRKLRDSIRSGYGFWVNLTPVCFEDSFIPDVDATYVTYEPEMKSYLGERISFEVPSGIPVPDEIIYLVGQKRGEEASAESSGKLDGN